MRNFDNLGSEESLPKDSLAIVILIEDSGILVTIPYTTFYDEMNRWSNENKKLAVDGFVLQFIVDEFLNGNLVINAVDVCKEKGYLVVLEDRIADLLEKSKCIIYDKNSLSHVSTIEVEAFGKSAEKPGWEGRRFYQNGKLFFEITDWR